MIVGGFDVHRRQITFDWVDRATGEARRGQIAPATRQVLRSWLGELPPGGGDVAVEGCTGWRFVAEELGAAGLTPHLAEPADTATLRAASGAPRPTEPTPATCASCWSRTACRSRGSLRRTSWTCGSWCGCARP